MHQMLLLVRTPSEKTDVFGSRTFNEGKRSTAQSKKKPLGLFGRQTLTFRSTFFLFIAITDHFSGFLIPTQFQISGVPFEVVRQNPLHYKIVYTPANSNNPVALFRIELNTDETQSIINNPVDVTQTIEYFRYYASTPDNFRNPTYTSRINNTTNQSNINILSDEIKPPSTHNKDDSSNYETPHSYSIEIKNNGMSILFTNVTSTASNKEVSSPKK